MTTNEHHPRLAIIDANTLAVLGLKQLLQTFLPMTIDTFGTMAELLANHAERYVHYFVSMSIVLENRAFFMEHCRRTIVLTLTSSENHGQLSDFHCICVNTSEKQLVRQLLMLEQQGHAHGHGMPQLPPVLPGQKVLSDREIEVMALIVQGYINKEIAARLNIGLSTVVTHRKNIMDKLKLKSVSALTIYAVTHGYVDINRI